MRRDQIFGKGKKWLDSSRTGLGLDLVQELVTHYGGEVWVEDNDPESAVFAVKLPLADTSYHFPKWRGSGIPAPLV